jgi:uncharacterized protein YecE (DUF72 family)
MSGMQAKQLRIGTSGYQYKHWKGVFYPETIRQKDWFEYYARFFDTVELNNTFYRLPDVRTFSSWRSRTPPGFCYVLKYSRYGSHIMHLKNPQQHVEPFLNNARVLGRLLGPILVQLPPQWRLDLARLEQFLVFVPRKHRWALEFRNPSWLCPEVYAVLRRHRAALCIHDMIPDHPQEVTSDWIYLRYHGSRPHGSYSEDQLRREADKIQRHRANGLDVFAYFNNDMHGHALINAADLREFVTGQPNPLRELQWFW